MKKYTATFWRSNPQLPHGGYEKRMDIEAKSMAAARKVAREYEEGIVYGTMTLTELVEEGETA